MYTKRIVYHYMVNFIIIALLGLSGGWYIVTHNSVSSMELPNAYLNVNLVSLYLQPVMLTLLYKQILTFRQINLFVGVRQQTKQMIIWLLLMTTTYCAVFVIGLFIPYLFTDYPFFKNGSPQIGTMLLLLHVGVLLFFAWLLVGAYNMPHPYLLLLAVIILSLVYHYYFEKRILVLYSPMYDPLYRAMHHIYGGY